MILKKQPDVAPPCQLQSANVKATLLQKNDPFHKDYFLSLLKVNDFVAAHALVMGNYQ